MPHTGGMCNKLELDPPPDMREGTKWASFCLLTDRWIDVLGETQYIDWVQDCSKSIANTLELLQSCTNPLICSLQLRGVGVQQHEFSIYTNKSMV